MATYVPDSAALLRRLVELHTNTISEVVADYGLEDQSVEELVMQRCAHDVALNKFVREYRERIIAPLDQKISYMALPKLNDDEIPF